uniref:Uncharacterized protein n=1 Tax=Panagrolaimus davidi TaxID=227884 RepID=A0A914R2I0_9BILA
MSWNITLKKWSFGFLILCGTLLIGAYCYVYWISNFTREKNDEFYKYLLVGTQWEIDGKVPPYGSFALWEFPNLYNYSLAAVIISYIIVIYCGISIFYHVKKAEGMLSSSDRKYQRQISSIFYNVKKAEGMLSSSDRRYQRQISYVMTIEL